MAFCKGRPPLRNRHLHLSQVNMPTPNERTVPSPERDEELERFLYDEIGNMATNLPTDVWMNDELKREALRALRSVAAFSARRAREKAIEECQNKIRSNYGGDEDEGLVEAVTLIEELKSPTNYPMILG